MNKFITKLSKNRSYWSLAISGIDVIGVVRTVVQDLALCV